MANKYLVQTGHGLNEGLNQLPSIIKKKNLETSFINTDQ